MDELEPCGCSSHNGFLTAKGLEEAAQRSAVSLEGLAVERPQLYLDKVRSVSGLRRDEIPMEFHEELIDEQYRRFLSAGGII